MRILQVIPYFYPAWAFGGPVRVAYHISQELAARGHEVTVFTTNVRSPNECFKTSAREYKVDGMRVRYFRKIARFEGLYFSPAIVRALKKQVQNTDIIHMHEYRSLQNIATYYFARKYKRPYVLTAHGSIPRVVEKLLLKQLFDMSIGFRILNGASKLLASSKIEMKQYMDTGISEDRIAIIPNGVDAKTFDSLPRTGAFKRKFGLDKESNIILYVGRIHKRKGIDFLVDAFARLNYSNAVLVIAGTGDNYVFSLKDKSARLGISEKVLFTGFISEADKLAAYVDSEVVVYPGVYESFPLVPIESALSSKPVIVSDDSIMAEIVRQGGFGFSTNYGDAAQLTELLLKILDNPKIAKEMGKKGREFVKKNYDWQGIVSKLETLYSRLIFPS
jgi:glycosyltransferase involved in cell wall biosynthesis